MQVKQVETLFGITLGSFAAYKVRPLVQQLEQYNRIWRKPWLRWPILLGTFCFGFHVATFLPSKVFKKFTRNNTKENRGVTQEVYLGDSDMVGRFRVFDRSAEAEGQVSSKTEEEILDYLSLHAKEPLTKKELVEHMMKKINKNVDFSDIFQVKRSGKDENDIYWSFGKIHGLENIAFVDDEKLKQIKGNPVTLQRLVNEIKPQDIPGYASREALLADRTKALENYKDLVNSMSLHPSDRKKLLALPFALSKRSQNPDPQIGMVEMELYEELTGRPWHY